MAPSISFSQETTTSQRRSSIYTSAQKKQKMSITQTYFLAHSARSKLSREAARADHNLRLLVGHANMLDNLMIDLANAEQEQERWFNKSLSGTREQEEISHVETIAEEPEEAEESDDSDYEEDQKDVEMEYDDDEDDSLALTRTVSRHSPPELTHDDESDSDEEHMPPSPPNLSVEHFATGGQPLFPSKQSSDFYLPTTQTPTIIAAY